MSSRENTPKSDSEYLYQLKKTGGLSKLSCLKMTKFFVPSLRILLLLDYAVLGLGENQVLFTPGTGILRVGESEAITCVVQPSAEGTFKLQDTQSRTDLISINETERAIKPPEREVAYTKYGSTTVTCTWTAQSGGQSLKKTLTVRILPKDLAGTLDGKTTGDLTLMAGDKTALQCGFLPPDAAGMLNGLWNATADPPEAATIQIPEGHTKAEILPPTEQGFLEVPGEFSVRCVFYSPENTVIHEFTQKVIVTPKTETTNAAFSLQPGWTAWTLNGLLLHFTSDYLEFSER